MTQTNMTDVASKRTRVASAQRRARAAGYSVRAGSYIDTTDDRLGRWYIQHESDSSFRPFGTGHATQGDAWLAVANALEDLS